MPTPRTRRQTDHTQVGAQKADTSQAQLKERGYSTAARTVFAGASAAANDTTSAMGNLKKNTKEGWAKAKKVVAKADSTLKDWGSQLKKQAKGELGGGRK